MILVSNYSANSVSVIDPSTDTVTRTLSSGFSSPMGIAFNSDGSKAYVTSNNSTTLTVIDTQTWAQSSITLSGPSCSAVTIGNDVYITSYSGTDLYKIDTDTDTVSATISLGSGNQGIAANLDGTKLYVACHNGYLKVINISDFSVESSLAIGATLSGVDISSDGTKIFVVDRGGNTFYALDAADYSVLGSDSVGTNSYGLGIQGNYAYVLSLGSSAVYVIDLNTYTVADTISTTTSPVSFGTFMVSTKMYTEVGPSSDATLSALSLSTGTLSPVFGADTTAYTASVANSVTSLKITPTVNDSNATVTVQGTSVTSGSESGWINLAVGDNTINVVVTAEDASTKTYTITVTRLPDTTAPALTAGDVSRTGDTAGTVKFTSDEAGSYYYAVVDDGAAPPAIDTSGAGTACTTSETTITNPTGLTTGAKDIYIKVKDAAGNVSDALKIDIAAYVAPDTTAPTLTAGAVSRTSDTAGTVKFTSDEAGSYYYAMVDDGAATPVIDTTGAETACTTSETTITNPTGLTAGSKDIYIKVKDAAGNISDALKIDIAAYVAPDTTAPSLAAGAVSRTGDTAGTVKFTSDEAGSYYYAVVDDGAAPPAIDTSGAGTACTTSETTITDPTGLTAGAKDIYIKVKDAAGNVSDALKIDIAAYVAPDTTAPTLTAGAVSRTSDTAGTVKFTSDEAGSYYYAMVDDGAATPVIDTTGAETACTTSETTITDPTGLTAGAKDIYIKVKDAAGNISDALKIDIAAYVAPEPEIIYYDDEPETDTFDRAEILVNGQAQTAGTVRTSTENDKTITTVTVDTDKLQDILEDKGDGATVTIPTTEGSDTSSGILTGQMVKDMEKKAATLAVKTDSSTYTLPAQEINIDKVAEQFGEDVGLSDIEVKVTISEPDDSTVQVTENAAEDGGFTLMVQPVEFTVECAYKGKSVKIDSYNAYVERTIKIPDGVAADKITTAVVVNADGTVRHVPTEIVKIDGVYYAVINSLTNSIYTLINNTVEFEDIKGHWAQNAINSMGSRMVINGDENGNFNPDNNITRAEFAAIVVRALGLAEGMGENTFSDVSGQDWYCGYIETASAYGFITGYVDGTFGPNDKITREQAMTIIDRAMEITKLNTVLLDGDISTLLGNYTDATNVSEYARESAAACVEKGIISGKGNGTLAPKDTMTRAEVAVVVQRLLQKSGLI